MRGVASALLLTSEGHYVYMPTRRRRRSHVARGVLQMAVSDRGRCFALAHAEVLQSPAAWIGTSGSAVHQRQAAVKAPAPLSTVAESIIVIRPADPAVATCRVR